MVFLRRPSVKSSGWLRLCLWRSGLPDGPVGQVSPRGNHRRRVAVGLRASRRGRQPLAAQGVGRLEPLRLRGPVAGEPDLGLLGSPGQRGPVGVRRSTTRIPTACAPPVGALNRVVPADTPERARRSVQLRWSLISRTRFAVSLRAGGGLRSERERVMWPADVEASVRSGSDEGGVRSSCGLPGFVERGIRASSLSGCLLDEQVEEGVAGG